jgi:hypothetical protein
VVQEGELHPPGRDGADGFLVDGDEFVQDHNGGGEDAVGMQEGVEEVDAQETQVGQSLQQPLHAGVPDLQHFARVHGFAETNVHIIAIQGGIRPGEGERRKN